LLSNSSLSGAGPIPEQFLRIPSVAVGETNAYPEFVSPALHRGPGIKADKKEYLSMDAIMQSNQEIDRIASPRNGWCMFEDRSCLWFRDVGRAALVAMVVGGAVALTTGCSSTGEGVNAGLIAPVVKAQASIVAEDGSVYQPPRSTGSNDLTGS
jgi:hypothetical protein